MTDDKPATPRRTRRRAPTAPEPQDLVGVMAPEPAASPAAAPDPAPAAAQEPAASPAVASSGLTSTMGPAEPAVFRLERGGIAEATAASVDVRLGGIGGLTAEDVTVRMGGIGAARADRVDVEFGSVGAGLAGELRVTRGMAGSVVAREATLEQSFVRTLVAQRVTATRPTGVLVMIAQHVSGDVRPLVDWRGALAFGALFGLVSVAWRALRARA